MEETTRYTGDGRGTKWPHPNNDHFNQIIRSAVRIYGIGSKGEKELLLKFKKYLHSRIEGIIEHKIVRDTEEYYQAMDLKIDHGIGLESHDQQNLIEQASVIMCVGDWASDKDCLQQYRMANVLGKPIYEIRYDSRVPFKNTVRYLQPVRAIEASSWDPDKQDHLLLYDNGDILEVIDGNHRHEFATRMGNVEHVSAWIIKQI